MVDTPANSPSSPPETVPPSDAPVRKRLWLPPTLFVLTLMTTSAVGALEYGLAGGMLYSASLVLILLCHEMGHYLTARHYRVPASLPYFIPVPLPPFGTFGAVIKMGGRIPDRKALFDIAIMGPAMGLILALPLAVLGIAGSTVTTLDSMPAGETLLGPSLLFAFLIEWIHGPLNEGSGLQLHPVATAGWAGLFVTALNLLPLGQLDGGHILYALFPRRSELLYRLAAMAFAVFAVLVHPPWLLLLLVVYLMTRLRHPPTMYEHLPIGPRRFALGLLAILFLIFSFPPIPISMLAPAP